MLSANSNDNVNEKLYRLNKFSNNCDALTGQTVPINIQGVFLNTL